MRPLAAAAAAGGETPQTVGEKDISNFLLAASSSARRSGVIDATPSLPRGDAEEGEKRITRTAHVQLIPGEE